MIYRVKFLICATVHVQEIQTIRIHVQADEIFNCTERLHSRTACNICLRWISVLTQVDFCLVAGRWTDLPCIRPVRTASGWYPAHGFSAPAHSGPLSHGGKTDDHRTGCIQTERGAETVYSSAHNRLLAPTPVFAFPANRTPAAATRLARKPK